MGNEVYTLRNFIKKEKVLLSMNTDEVVKKYKLYNLVSEDLLNREARLFRAFTCNIQTQKNKLFLSELVNIMKFASPDMKIVLFKGLTLAYNYYTNPEERWFNDVDIFTHDVNKVIKLLISQGYSLEKQYKSKYYLYMGECYEPDSDGYFNKLELNHIECYKDIDNMHIVIEIHKNILNRLRYPDVNQDEIYERCTSNFFGIDALFELEKHDLLLYQVCHFSTHLCAYMSYVDKDRLETLPSIPIRYIHDIMLIIQKEQINWKLLLERAKKWNIEGNLLLCLKLANYLYGDCVDAFIITTLVQAVKKIKTRDEHNTFINDISLLDVSRIFNCDFKSCIRENTVSKIKPSYSVYHSDTNVDVPILINHESGVLLSAICKWDKSHFSLKIDARKMSPQFVLCITIGAERKVLSSDNLFVKVKGTTCKVTNIPDNFESNPESWVEKVRCKIDCDLEEKTKLILLIPWEALNLVPKQGMRIPFNIRIMYLDENDNLMFRKSLAGKTYYNNYDLTSVVLN